MTPSNITHFYFPSYMICCGCGYYVMQTHENARGRDKLDTTAIVECRTRHCSEFGKHYRLSAVPLTLQAVGVPDSNAASQESNYDHPQA